VEVAPSSTTSGRTQPARACPAASLVVTSTSHETLAPTWLPAGWVLSEGNPADLGTHGNLTYTPPGGGDPPRVELLRYNSTMPLAQLSSGSVHQRVTVQGHSGLYTSGLPALLFTSVGWVESPGVEIVVSGYKLDEPTLLRVADGVTYQPGATFTYPTHPPIRLTRAEALATIHDTTADGRAILTSAGEFNAVTDSVGPGEHITPIPSTVPVTTPVWVVWDDPLGPQLRPAFAINADSGVRLAANLDFTKISRLTDRSGPACAPPFGVLTRSEVLSMRPAAPGTKQTAILTTFARFAATYSGRGFAQCNLESCDPTAPLWVLISTAPDQRFVDEERGPTGRPITHGPSWQLLAVDARTGPQTTSVDNTSSLGPGPAPADLLRLRDLSLP
jgi:hypothetical protein